MIPSYAVMLKGTTPITLDALRQAFSKVPGMTPMDADAHCRDACGIVVRKFGAEQAAALQAGLKANGVEAEIVPSSSLPALPVGRVIRRIELGADALMVFDAIGMQFKIKWEGFALLGAGAVQISNISRSRQEWKEVHVSHLPLQLGLGVPLPVTQTRVEYSSREKTGLQFRAELITAKRGARYLIEAENFAFGPMAGTADEKFLALIRDLAQHSPNTVLNSGAHAIVNGAEPVEYSRKNAIEDELTWMLWWAETQQGRKL